MRSKIYFPERLSETFEEVFASFVTYQTLRMIFVFAGGSTANAALSCLAVRSYGGDSDVERRRK